MNSKKTQDDTQNAKNTQQEKSLLTMLREQAEQATSCQGTAINFALFLANKEEILEAISAGWNSKAIWRVLRSSKKFNGSYESFRKYVKQYVLQKQLPEIPQGAAQKGSLPDRHIAEKQNSQASQKFEFSATPNETDLI